MGLPLHLALLVEQSGGGVALVHWKTVTMSLKFARAGACPIAHCCLAHNLAFQGRAWHSCLGPLHLCCE